MHENNSISWDNSGFQIAHELTTKKKALFEEINEQVKYSVMKGKYVHTDLLYGTSSDLWLVAERKMLNTHFKLNRICSDPILNLA